MNGMRFLRSLMVIVLVVVVLGTLASRSSVFIKEIGTTKQMDFGELARRVKNGEVESLIITNDIARVELKRGVGGDAWRYKHTVVLPDSPALQKFYEMAQERVKTLEIRRSIWQGVLGTVVVSFLLPVLFIVALYMFIARQNAISGNQALNFGRSRAKRLTDNMPKVTFEDVAGVDEAKQELQEVVEFLKHPEKFQALGAKIPKGVLLLGPPGCGKTLLARAIAGEAGVPFFHISGSDFVEMFVGVGASVMGDTPILVKTDGSARLTTIGEFVDSYYEGEAEGYVVRVNGVQTLGFAEKESKFKGSPKQFFGRSQWVNVRGVYRHRVHEIYEIHYLGGVVRTTGDHSVFVRTRNGIHPKAARDLKPGDMLVALPMKARGEFFSAIGTTHSVRGHNVAPASEPIELPIWEDDPAEQEKYAFALAPRETMSQYAIARTIGVSQATVGNWQNGKYSPRALSRNYTDTELPETITVTPVLMKLFGYYTAEGRCNNSLEFVFGAHETELHDDCTALMREVFGLEPSIELTPDNTARIRYGSAPLGRFFARHCGNGCHNKHIPAVLWDLPWEYFEAYLDGYSRGDGYITQEGKLSITSVSQQLIRELTWLCAMHGIKAGVREIELKGGRVIREKPLPDGKAWNLIIDKTSNPFALTEVLHPAQGKKPVVREVVVKPYDGYVYDLCGCDNEAFFGGEQPLLLHNSRVRDLFDQAKAHRPCLVFIDEIDAVGRHRGAGLGGGHDEREQTLNQLLVEMDGFDPNIGVILIAATNRPDVLDPALLRPGRFDRRIVVDNPDAKGRKEILKVHTKGKPLASDVDLELLARRTPGFSGADLANLVNEAALLAARRNKTQISRQEFDESVERVAMGPERKSRLIKDKEKRITAYHEGGHALVAKLLPDSDPVHKVTILPRGMAMGYVLSLPEDDRYMSSKSELLAKITMALGGRVAEEVVLGDITTGAESDLQYATELARRMICEFGMSENLGPLSLGRRHGPVFLGRDLYEERNYSEEVAAQIDKEIRAIVEECYARAKELIENNRDKLERIVVALLEKETIDGDELDALINGTERPEVPPPLAAAPLAPDVPTANEPRRTPQPRPKPGLAGA